MVVQVMQVTQEIMELVIQETLEPMELWDIGVMLDMQVMQEILVM